MHFSSRPVPRRQNSPPSFLGLRPFRNVCFHTGTDLQNHRTHVLYTYNHKVYLIYISHRSLTVNAQILCGKMYDLRHRKTIYNNKTTELAQLEENAIEKKGKSFIIGLWNADYKSPNASDLVRQPRNPAALSRPPPPISTPRPPYPSASSHLPFFTSSHPLRPPSSRCTACLLSPEELKVALIWSPGFLQIVAEGASASEWSFLGTVARNAAYSARGK